MKTLYYGLEYQVIHTDLITSVGSLYVPDMHDTWLHIQKLNIKVKILSSHPHGMCFDILANNLTSLTTLIY